MNPPNTPSRQSFNLVSRRRFVAATGATALAACTPSPADAQGADAGRNQAQGSLLTGNGEWTYEVVPEWGILPAGTIFGGTHGAIAQDKSGHIYVSTQSATGVLVYSPDGALTRTIATEYPEIHSMVHTQENSEEYLYVTVQKGTPKENWFFLKNDSLCLCDSVLRQKPSLPPPA